MPMDTTPPEVKPEVSFIYDLLRELGEGRIRIPGFHRPYVWRREQMLELLDSVYLQYPIGNLILWEPGERYRTLDWVGPLKIPVPKGSTALILDGQQRLSTLAGVLLPGSDSEHNPRDEDPGRWDILFNARYQQFEHLKADAPLQPCHFPLKKLMDTVQFLTESTRIVAQGGGEADTWLNRILHLARAFQNYRLPIVRIKSARLEQALEIFARLNSKGQRLSADQMVSALVYEESGEAAFDLSRYIDELHGCLVQSDFGDVDRTTLLRLVLVCLGQDIYRIDWTAISRGPRSAVASQLAAEWPQIQEAVASALKFLREQCGVYHERLLPYAMQLVVLTGFFFHQPRPSVAQLRFARRWFWVSSFTGWGASSNSIQIGAVAKEFSTTVAQGQEPQALENMRLDEAALPFPKSFDMRSARVRALLLVLLAEQPTRADGEPIGSPWRLIGTYGPQAIGHVLYRVEGELGSSPANRIIKPEMSESLQGGTPPGRRAQAKSWLLRVPAAAREGVLRSHAIPPEAYDALKNNRHEEFIRLRQQYLIELERRFMERERVTLPSGAAVPQFAPIDTGDDESSMEPLELDGAQESGE